MDRYQVLIDELCSHFNTSEKEVFTHAVKVKGNIADVRKILAYYLKPTHTLKEIAHKFKLTHHTTIIHYLRQSENMLRSSETLRYIFYRSQETFERIPIIHLESPIKSGTNQQIKQIKNGRTIKVYTSVKEAAMDMKVSRHALQNARKWGTKCAGYNWKNV